MPFFFFFPLLARNSWQECLKHLKIILLTLFSHLSFKVRNVKTLILPLQGRPSGSLITCCFFGPHLMNVFSLQCSILKQKHSKKNTSCVMLEQQTSHLFPYTSFFSAIMWWVTLNMTIIPTYNANIKFIPNSSCIYFIFFFFFTEPHVLTEALSPTFKPPFTLLPDSVSNLPNLF